jgi:hypothetical protein
MTTEAEIVEEPLAQVKFSCGRSYLSVAGIALAMEGDKCRDGDLPPEIYEPIPEHEMEHGTIGGEPVKGMDPALIRFFRGSCWTEGMLKYAADKINAIRSLPLHAETVESVEAEITTDQPNEDCADGDAKVSETMRYLMAKFYDFKGTDFGDRCLSAATLLRSQASAIATLEAFARSVRDNYDCDDDAHKYGTPCLACDATRLLPAATPPQTEAEAERSRVAES